MLLRTLTCAFAVIALIDPARATDQLVYGPPPAWVAPVTAPKPGPDTEAPVRVLYQNRQLQFSRNSVASFSESFVRVQTSSGLAELGSLNLPWRTDSEVLTIHKVHLQRGDKVIDLLANGQAFTILRREDRLDQSMLDGVLTASLQPAGIEVGDILNIAFTLERTHQVLDSPDYSVGDLDLARVDKLDFRATWDKPTAIRWYATPEVKGIKESRKGPRTELTWSAIDLGPITQPVDVPLRYWIGRRIDFTTTKSWNDLSKRIAPLFATASTLKPDSPLHAEAAAIRAAHSTPEARAGAALKLAQDRVRYLFMGMDGGALIPTSADVTWSQKFGDCKAKSALLIALLRELGIDAEPVMVNVNAGDGIDSLLPMGIVFNHVLVRAHIGERAYWLDGTSSGDTRLAFLETPNYHWGLPLRAAGGALIPLISPALQEPSRDQRIRIDATKGIYAAAPITVETTMRGAYAVSLRTEIARLPRPEQERALRDYWSRQYGFVSIKSVSSSHDESSGAYTLKMAGDAKLEWNDSYYETDGLQLGRKVDLERGEGPNKDAPYLVDHPVYTRVVEEIVLPGADRNFKIYGTDIEETVGGVKYSRRAVIKDGVFRGEATMRSVANEFPANQAQGVEAALLAMMKNIIYVQVLKGYKYTTADLDAEYGDKLTSADAYVKRSRTLKGKLEYRLALADANSALELDPRSDSALAERGEVHYRMENYDAALNDANSALAINPKNASALTVLGALAERKKDPQAALKYVDQAIEIDPKSAMARGVRTHALAALGKADKALAEANEALALSPAWSTMYQLRVQLLGGKLAWSDLDKELDRMLKALPNDAELHTLASRHYRMMLARDKALTAAERAVELEPSADAYLARAEAHPLTDVAARTRDVDAALALEPENPLARAFRTTLLDLAGDHEGAAAHITEIMKNVKSSTERKSYLIARGVQYAKAGKTGLAEADFNSALGENPEAWELNNFCRHAASSNVMLDRALSACERAIALNPGIPIYFDSKGLVLLQLSRFDEAIRAYDAALAASKWLGTSFYGRGMAKQRLCNCPAGNEDMTEGRRLLPNVESQFEKYGLSVPRIN